MKHFFRALSAECIKLKRSLALWLTLLTPGALVFIEAAGATQNQGRLMKSGVNLWALMFEELFTIWVVLILPLFITLETALLGQLEHSNRTWKVVHAQPVSRWATLAAKQVIGTGFVVMGMILLVGLTFVGGAVLELILPEFTMTGPIPWEEMFQQIGIATLASGIIIAFHTWIGLRSRSFVVASAIGIGMTIAGLILTGLEWTYYFPWSLAANALFHYYQGWAISSFLVLGGVGYMIFSIISNLHIIRMEVTD